MKGLFSTPALPGACRDEAEKTSPDASHSPAAERLPLSRSLPLRRPTFSKVSFTKLWRRTSLGHLWLWPQGFPFKTNGTIIFAWRRALYFFFLSCALSFFLSNGHVKVHKTIHSSRFRSYACRRRMQMVDVKSQMTLVTKFKTHSCVSVSHHMWCDGISRSPG